MSQFNYSRNITFDIIRQHRYIGKCRLSQFNYSRNITFDTKPQTLQKLESNVAIQLFAEYNF